MKRDFKSLFRKFCLESTVLGLKYLYIYPDPLSRCFWIVSIVSSLAMAGALSVLLYARFADLPTRVAIESQYASLHNVSYPAVSVCSPNQITVSAMAHLERTLVDGNMTLDLKSVLPRLLGFYELLGDTTDDLNGFQYLITTLNRYRSAQIMGMMPQSCEDFLKLCYLKNVLYPNCKGLFTPILTTHGMCCIFNSVYFYNFESFRNEKLPKFSPHKASTGGLGEALTVVTDYNPDNALSGTIISAGATRVMFTESSEFPADDESSLVYSYSESFHFIHATYTYCSEDVASLPYWSRQCYFEHERPLPFFRQYHNSDCDLACYVRAIERRCRCTMIYMPHIKLSRACNITNIDCIVRTRLEMNRWHHTDECDCLRDCVSFRYQVEVSVGNLNGLADIMHQPYSGIKFNKSTSILHFFFRNSVYSKQKQETVMSLINLSSNLGGVFGLCLGCSVMSVVEIIFYIYCFIKNRIKRRLQKLCNSRVTYSDAKEWAHMNKINQNYKRKLRESSVVNSRKENPIISVATVKSEYGLKRLNVRGTYLN